MNRPARLEAAAITKLYPGVIANDDVNLSVMPGEIHALLGENGAGKSTLVKIIYGVQRADSGQLSWEGETVRIPSPHAARRLGIGMVFQHFSLFEAMTVEENIALGLPPQLARGNLAERIRDVSVQYGLPLDPERLVHSLSVGERQRIEVVRCLLQNPRLLIMDEPTSVLTPQEAETLFETLRRLATEDVAILYISHRLEEIRSLCDTATVMRRGRVVAECDPARETARSLAEMMMGENFRSPEQSSDRSLGRPLLNIENLSAISVHQHGTDLNSVNLTISAGEVVGIAGIAGNGQRELMEALTGEVRSASAGIIRVDGKSIGQSGPMERRAEGMVFVPEERVGQGAVVDLSLWENGLLSAMGSQGLSRRGFINTEAATAFAERVVNSFRVKTPGVSHVAGSLSGGNLQKFIVGREILQDPKVIIAVQPTWGVDAGSAAAIRQALMDLAVNGTAVLVISQDLEELFEISDRIAVICDGRLSEARPVGDLTVEDVGLMMSGLDTGAGAPADDQA